MIVDEVKLTVTAGKGGDGAVSFRREKYVPKGGPDGGNGGKGGNVYFVGVSDLAALNQFRNKKEIKGNDGVPGGKKKMNGADGEHIYANIPVGTIITNERTGGIFEVREVGNIYKVVQGGVGGLGSFDLRSSTNTTPLVAEKGTYGEKKMLFLNMQYIADIGLIGLPNGGKSSLLNALTHTEVKTADYPFTTLEPNLGEMEGLILADIPGLIEGAHTGRGLGIRFLKHIEKTHLLLHCIDCTSTHLVKDYKVIRKELGEYNPMLLEKKEVILLTKTDMIETREVEKKVKQMKKYIAEVIPCSVLDDKKTSDLKKYLLSQDTMR